MAKAIVLTAPQKMALMNMEGKAKGKTSLDIFNEFTSLGLSEETVITIKEISMKTAKDIVGKTIEVGKIIVMKIIEFIKENPGLTVGMAIGGAIGALTVFVPFIGAFIAPLSIGLGIASGAIIGNNLSTVKNLDDAIDKTGELFDSPVTVAMKNAVSIAKKFFKLLKEIFLAIFKPQALN